MKLLFLNHNVAEGGGTYYRAFHAARYLVRRGHDVTLLTISPTRRLGFDSETRDGVEIVLTPDLLWGRGRTGWDLWDALRRAQWVCRRRWDVIHAWDCRPAVILPALGARRHSGAAARLVIDWSDWWGRGGAQSERPASLLNLAYGPVETFFEERFRTRADATTVASAALRERVIALGVRPERVMILPGGCDIQTIRPMDRDSSRERLQIPRESFVVGYMGAMPASDGPLVAEALQAARLRIPSMTVLAIGASVAGSTIPFRELMGTGVAAFLTETGRIRFERVGSHLAACDVLLLAMRDNVCNTARWPSKINDYLAAGRPIVATRVGEVARRFDDRIGAVVDPAGTSIADALVRLANDPARAEAAGRHGRSLAEGELNWTKLASELERHYRDAEHR